MLLLLRSAIGLHSIRTGASTLHNYETLSGLRFALFTSNDISANAKPNKNTPSVREALQHIYSELWVECVIRSPLYRVGSIEAAPSGGGGGGDGNSSSSGSHHGNFDIQSTNFEKKLEEYFATMSWFR